MGIACSLYDQLEIMSSNRQAVRLVFEDKTKLFEGQIKTLTAKSGKEFAVSATDEWVDLDGLLAIEMIKPTD
ncbi:hypothetical protein [Thiosulfativibrio zosterae]|uniref:Uncharacterized protein n=1 Tax=Thiosulfativibrio zosterae TaxID=2675053 RepID=A0A6F8PNX9_9GAMM|nr:hypothetical protein [Thiosulfativibrio zosterae]BBP43758.1 hypothetical protein THMIRHAT_15040 [Thiosulfativibrio zosterae]